MDYSILHNEFLPPSLQNKPRWMTCLVCTAGLLIITLSAVSVGAFVGYTYCYMEHRRGFRPGEMTHATKLRVTRVPSQYDENDKKTINSVLFSSVLVSRLVQFGQNLKDDVISLSLPNFKNITSRKRLEPNVPEFM